MGGIVNFMRYSFFKKDSKNRIAYFHRLIWLMFMSICIPVVLVGIIYYKVSVSHLTEEVKKQYMSSLQLAVERAEDKIENIESKSFQLSINKTLEDSFKRENFKEDYIYHKSILESMIMRKNMDNHGVKEILYYNDLSKLVLSTDYGYVLKVSYPYQTDIDKAFSISKAGWMYLPKFSSKGFISYVRLLPVMGISEPQGALIINVEETFIANELASNAELNEHSNYLVLDSNGNEMFVKNEKNALDKQISTKKIFENISSIDGKSGIIKGTNEQGQSILSLYIKTISNRVYIAYFNEEAIVENLNWIKFMILYTVLIFLVIAITMSYICTKFAYSPVDRLIKHSQKLTEKRNILWKSTDEFEYIL